MPSLRYEVLANQLAALRAHLLPEKFDPTGVYSDEWITRARAYRVLAHAEIEAYLEDRARDAAKAALERWKRDKFASPCLLGLVGFSGLTMDVTPETVAPTQPSAAKVHAERLSLTARVNKAGTAWILLGRGEERRGEERLLTLRRLLRP